MAPPDPDCWLTWHAHVMDCPTCLPSRGWHDTCEEGNRLRTVWQTKWKQPQETKD